MKHSLLLLLTVALGAAAPRFVQAQTPGVGIGTTAPDASAALEIRSTTQGLLLPRLTLAQRQALGTGSLAAPVAGLVIFQTDNTPGLYAYDGAGWVLLKPDNLGNHTATQNLALAGNALTGTGASIGPTVGVGVRADGGLNLGQNTGGNNIFLGYQAGPALTTGSLNVLLGYQAGFANTTGANNLFSGYRSGYANTTGSFNLFTGTNSGLANTTGRWNLFSGYDAGQANTTGERNQFSGYQSGYSNTTGSNNLFSGYQAGYANTTGTRNQFSGYQSGGSNTTGTDNLFNGFQAGYSNTTGSYNTFAGFNSGISNTTGETNLFAGAYSGLANTTGSRNVFSGTSSGFYNTTGNDNSALGYGSGPASGSGAIGNATAVGANVTLTQSNTVVLGNGASVGIGTSTPHALLQLANGLANRKLVLFETTDNDHEYLGFGINAGALRYQVANAGDSHVFYRGNGSAASVELMRIAGSGFVGIGTPTPSAPLDVNGAVKIEGANTLEFGAGVSGKDVNAGKIGYKAFSADGLDIVGAGTTGSNRVVRVYAEGGTIFSGPVTGVGAFNSSDRRLKQDIRPLTGALALVQALHGRRYQWNALGVARGGAAQAEQVGIIAQELEPVLPELVSTGPDGYKAVNYAQLTPVLIEALKEQQQIEALQARVVTAEAEAGAATADHASLLTLQAQVARLLGADGQARK